MCYDNQEIHDNSVPGCFVLFEYRIDIFKCKINQKIAFKCLLIEPFIEKNCFLWGFSKEVQKEPTQVVYKKVVLKTLQYSQENTCVGVSFNKVTGLKTSNFIKRDNRWY